MINPRNNRTVLAVDIGNTTIALGIVSGLKVAGCWRIETGLADKTLRQQLRRRIRFILSKYPGIQEAVVCSVVPRALKIVGDELNQAASLRVRIVGRDINVPIKNLYRRPKQVGQDRLVCAYAAKTLYGFPSLVIDLGTAITYDVVSAQGTYLGGIIVPGIKLSAESLFRKTALLPKIKIQGPRLLIGKDTKGSILSGLFYGYGAMSEGLILQITAKLKKKPVVVLTGGYTKVMKDFIKIRPKILDEGLVFKGLSLLLSA